jgi:UDP-N-acetyl-alpha-D-muramoyl-L-alanyl-L-glutamate epimerase
VNQSRNHDKYIQLRKENPVFVYDSYRISITPQELKLSFHFSIGEHHKFQPEIIFPKRNIKLTDRLSDIEINKLAFHIGMIELISYWKCCCSPKIIIKANHLSDDQISWWKKIYFNGLGEFFYLNGIEADIENFVEIEIASEDKHPLSNFKLEDKILLPIGGGKDSIVSLELLKQSDSPIIPMALNLNPARERTILNSGFNKSEIVNIKRSIDPELIRLNDDGYLNGHTPFSALLAFTSLLSAVLNNCKYIALSNESSANESTVANSNINHQYSKSFEFETDFRNYVAKYISPDIQYFSFLRPLNELQIGKIFSEFKSYFPVFRSCNVGSKTDVWCGKCPKCLFTYIILSPFIAEEKLNSVFSKNLLDDLKLKPVFDELAGIAAVKPFECVGTVDDVNGALNLSLQKKHFTTLPKLLDYYQHTDKYKSSQQIKSEVLLNDFNDEHYLNDFFISLLKAKLND